MKLRKKKICFPVIENITANEWVSENSITIKHFSGIRPSRNAHKIYICCFSSL